MSGGYSRKFFERQCKIQLPGENLGEQKIPEIQNFDKHSATSRIYWVYYNRPVLSYLDVGWNVWW